MQFHCYNFYICGYGKLSFKSGLSGFSASNCSPSHANALHPASVRIGKFKFIGKAKQRVCEESGKMLHHDDRWNQSYRLEKPYRNKSVLTFLEQSLCTHLDLLLLSRWQWNHLACQFVSPCPLLYFPFLLFCFFLFHFLFFFLYPLLFFGLFFVYFGPCLLSLSFSLSSPSFSCVTYLYLLLSLPYILFVRSSLTVSYLPASFPQSFVAFCYLFYISSYLFLST